MSEATETTEISDGVYLCSLIRSHDDDDDIQLESELRETSKKKSKKKSNNEVHIDESSENFTPFQHEYPLHESNVNLPNKDLELEIQLYFIFLKFFSNQLMKTI